MAKKKKKKNIKGKKKPNRLNAKKMVLLMMFMIVALLYMPVAILFFVGMLPTLVVYFTDRIPGKNKTFTIGSMNFAGCFYYMISIWTVPKPMDVAIEFLSDPMTIIAIYSMALIGYAIDYSATIFIAAVLRQKSEVHLKKLEDKKKKLEERWGEKVNGERPLDAKGFPLKNSNF